jgi:threonine dehydratase
MQSDVSAVMVRDAEARIRPLVRRTPVFSSRSINRAAGVEVHFKCENLQRGGAFKIRGAFNLILSIPNEDLPRGVVAFSSGNHAQAVAIAAAHVGATATIVMPADAPRAKRLAQRSCPLSIIR